MSLVPTIGLYRHFKGEYYFVQNIVRDCSSEVVYCQYFNVCKPEQGVFVRPIDDWFSTETDKGAVVDRKDNVTGQMYRFERVLDLNFQLGSVSTEQLTKELVRRTDSPIHELDIEGLQSNIDCKDYVVGQHYKEENYIATVNSFNTESQAKIYLVTHKVNSETHLYKRTFIRIK